VASRSRLTVYHRNVPPIDRTMVRCAVCSQYVDMDRTQSPDESALTHIVHGSVYFAKTSSGEIDLQAIDKTVVPVIPAYSSCWFCGSPRFIDGAPGPLRR
jgi:hypothetical protein